MHVVSVSYLMVFFYGKLVNENVTEHIEVTRSICIPTGWVDITRCRVFLPALATLKDPAKLYSGRACLYRRFLFLVRSGVKIARKREPRLDLTGLKKIGSLEQRNFLFR